MRLGRRFIFKSFRRPRPGSNPELEVSHFLTTRTSFPHAAGLVGWADYAPGDGEPSTVALLQPFLENRGDAWRDTLAQLRRLGDALVQEPAPAQQHRREHRLRELGGDLIEDMALLGTITGELHAALAGDDSGSRVRARAGDRGGRRGLGRARPRRRRARARRARAARDRPHRAGAERDGAAARRAAPVAAAPRRPRATPGGAHVEDPRPRRLPPRAGAPDAGRLRGDRLRGRAGAPAGRAARQAAGAPRRGRDAPLLRLRRPRRGGRAPPTEAQALGRWVSDWTRLASSAFVRGYLGVITRSPRPLAPTSPDTLRRASAVFEIDKALYELHYELAHRPDWVPIPIAGLTRLLRPKRGE